MIYVEINKKCDKNISPYSAYFPHQFKIDDMIIDMNIAVEVTSEIQHGILEYQRYEIKSIDTFEKEYLIDDDYVIQGVTIDESTKSKLISSIYEMLENNEHIFLKS